ncbi:MAG: LysR family transcriptional regulator [Dehalococcoidia bacterium]
MQVISAGLDQRRLEHFLAAARCGSINRAAGLLGISQAGLSKSLQTLEASLEVPLFSRGSKGVALTKYGEMLFAHASLIQNMYGAASRAISAARSGHAGTLNIGIAPNWFLENGVAMVLAELLPDSRRPRFRLTSGTNSWSMLGQLRTGELDLVIGTPTEFDDLQDLVFHHGVTDVQGVVVARSHPLARLSSVSLQQLDEAGWVLAEEDTFYRRVLTGVYQAQMRLLPTPLLTSHSSKLILDVLTKTRHVGVGTRLLMELNFPDQLAMLKFPARVKRPTGVIHRKGDPLTDFGQATIETILSALQSFEREVEPE